MKKFFKLFVGTVFMGACGMLLFGRDANAYIDPSAVTYVIQAVAGVAIALGAVVGIGIRRMKKKLNDKLGIDENRNKEVESDEIVVDKKENM